MNEKPYLRFEFINEFGYKTVMEKFIDRYIDSELDTVVYEFINFLKACGFAEESIKDIYFQGIIE